MERLKVLLLEDDTSLGMVLQEHLQMQGFEVTLCVDGDQGLKVYRRGKFDLCLVDIMMPKRDGFSFAENVRQMDQDIPLIFLTAKSMKEDKVKGFKIGCDDYVTKPFSVEELMLRIEAVRRRTRGGSSNDHPTVLRIGSYSFDHRRQLLTRGKHRQKLTSKETDLLRLLCINMNQIVLRENALRQIWGEDSYFTGRSMDVFISKLRKYLKEDPNVEIMGIHGKGFRLIAD